jgi:hypothetical protein
MSYTKIAPILKTDGTTTGEVYRGKGIRPRMTNDECQMTKESPMPNDEACQPRLFGHSGFGIDSEFVIRR